MNIRNKLINTSNLHFIGYSVGILPNIIVIRDPHYSNLNKFMVDNIAYNHTSIGTLVVIESNNYFFIGIIIKEDMSEHDTKTLINENKPNRTETPEIFVKILSEINPYTKKLIEFSQHTPVINSKVYLANEKLIKQFINQISRGMHSNKTDSNDMTLFRTTNFASLSQNRNVLVNLPFNALFSKHLGIIGSTGSGKSYTAAKLILNLVKQGQHVVLLDPTGEYKNIVNTLRIDMYKKIRKWVLYKHNIISNREINKFILMMIPKFDIGNDTKLPYYDLNDNELYKLIHPSSGIQFPKLKDSIKDLKYVASLNKNQIKYNKYVDCNKHIIKFIGNAKTLDDISHIKDEIYKTITKSKYNFNDLPNQIKEECYHEAYGKIKEDNRTWGYCAPLADRIESNKYMLSKYFCNLFNKDKHSKKSTKFQKALKFHNVTTSKILYVDLEHVTLNDYVAEVIGDYIARKLLESFVKKSDKKTPVVLFLDEAHNFIKKDDVNDDYNLHYFDLIAKEGRKYGLFMTLITQSPYDLSRDVLTQFGTFIIHHLGNGKEREQITSALPYNSNLDKYISSLNTGEAIISSNDLYSPLMVYIHKPSIPPKSNTPKFK